MPLADILNKDIIDLEVKGNTKDEVLHYMADVLCANGYINDTDVFVKDIYEREAEGHEREQHLAARQSKVTEIQTFCRGNQQWRC